jgi:hypothetical protein
MMIKGERANGIVVRLREAQEGRDWTRMSEILEEADENDIMSLESIISDLVEHDKWLIRVSTVERIVKR